jgi:uncharacterized protein
MDNGQLFLDDGLRSIQVSIDRRSALRLNTTLNMLHSVFWLSFGFLLLPTLNLAGAYSTTGSAAEGAVSKEYNAVIALYLIVWGFVLLMFFIFTLKTNMVFAGIFLFVTLGAWILSGAYWKVSTGDYDQAGQLQKVS